MAQKGGKLERKDKKTDIKKIKQSQTETNRQKKIK